MATGRPAPRLDSWKEIAAFLDRDIRTVQRWEKLEGLPVHRHLHDRQGSVFAFEEEIEAWRERRRVAPAAAEEAAEAPVEVPEAPLGATTGGAKKDDKGLRRWWIGAILVLFLAGSLWGLHRVLARRPGRVPAVAVLPFANLSGDPAQEYVSEGMTEELITRLSRQEGARCRVVAHRSLRDYRNTSKRPGQIAAELGVDFVLEGSVRRSGERVRVAVHLIRTEDGSHLWDESYDRDFRDVLALQGDVADAISRGFDQTLSPRLQPSAPARPVLPMAYEAYLKGRYLWNRRTPQDLLEALEQFRRAAELDGTYAPTYVGLADCQALLGSAEMGVAAPNDAMPLAKQALRKALALDPDSAEAHASLAHLLLVYDWDFPGSEREFRRAIELNPGYPTAHQWYALLLLATGRTVEAKAELQKAELLDPRSPLVLAAQSEAHYFAREYELAEAYASKSLNLDPGFLLGLVNLARAQEMQGRHAEAVQLFEKGWSMSGKAPMLAAFLGYAMARGGDRRGAQSLLQELRHPHSNGGRPSYVPAVCFAAVHAGLGERDAMFQDLDRALQERCEYLVYLNQDPMADLVRADPRFQALLRTVGLA